MTISFLRFIFLVGIVYVSCTQICRAQVQVNDNIVNWMLLIPEGVGTNVQVSPAYIGGSEALNNLFYLNLNSSSSLTEKSLISIKGFQSRISFKLSEEGKVSDIKFIKSSLDVPSLNEKIKQILLNMQDWTPCVIDGKAVAIRIGFTLNLNSTTFKLTE